MLRGLRVFALVAASLAVASLAAAQAARPRPNAPAATPSPTIDDLNLAQLKRLNIQAAPICSDAVFLRRAYLDTIGTLPTADETRAFLADQDPGKRSQLIDRLLGRPEFADYWAMKWSDLLRVKSEFPINLWPNAVQAYHHWIRTAVRDNVPYDAFVREMLTESGSNFRVPPVNFYRAVQSREPTAIAQAVALTFMGARLEKWPADRVAGMAAFFTQIGYKPTGEWKEEIVFFNPDKGSSGSAPKGARAAVFPDGTTTKLPDQDPREVFAQWLVAPANPWFARAIVNRIWSWLMGRGIVNEPDDIRPDNPPDNPELLAFLERELVAKRYDLKHIYRLILTSAAYQGASLDGAVPTGGDRAARYVLRPLDAEVLIDALNQVTDTTEGYSSAIPEPYTFTPLGQRAIALADGSITSSFLETFGRPPRDTGLESERTGRPSAAARLTLLNSTQIQRKLEQSPKLQALIQARVDLAQVYTNLYLTILSRFPTDDELKIAGAYQQSAGANRRIAALDLAWALVNSTEFLYRH